ncbi:MAG: lipase family protein [Planctomycetes bacterium]|nr:lipase family protein [Planctomycetota bacterium]
MVAGGGLIGGQVHGGFKAAFDSIWPDVEQYLKTAPSDVWFTGHSLGGAVATLAAARHGSSARLYTYGSPRVGTPAFRPACINWRFAARTPARSTEPARARYRVGENTLRGESQALGGAVTQERLRRAR